MVSTAQFIPKNKTRNWWLKVSLIVGIVAILAIVLPFIIPAFRLRLLGRFLALAITALGIDLIWGYTGLLSLGHGIFFGLGGYIFAMYLNLQTAQGGLPSFFTSYGVSELPLIWQPFRTLPITVIGLIVIPGIVAGILGYLVFRNRIKGVYFSILTQAALIVFFNFFNGQQRLVNGSNGLTTETQTIFGTVVSSPVVQITFYELTIVSLILVYLLCFWLTRGRFGRLLIAIRDDETRVRFSGYDPTWFKVVVFSVSGAIAGLSGALFTVQTGIVTPGSSMDVAFSIEMVIWVAVGGRGTLLGAIIGAVLVRSAQTFLSEEFPAVWLFFQGALFLIVVTVLPNGIVGWWREWAWLKIKSLLGLQPTLLTYPEIDLNAEVMVESNQQEED
ncbi:urea ABC transporter membrane protein [Cyanobacterium stanieri PCC 7202]|uniref:Urea ABC transporter membrane protein n=1 Tax=Cyanobacterium stanieri (strain ATCC 29140 / PCC 7202) TaxID=292563 RepID=K9YMH4_CYASC|nr:urea ABC transporter membrane protein [Cyanobacterium stanieri PCC 7202]